MISDEARAFWKEHPADFPPERYAYGYPVLEDGNFSFRPWPEGSDLGAFAKRAAEEMHLNEDRPYPPDVYNLALSLRRIYVLETLGLPADPKSVNVVRMIEAMAQKDDGIVPKASGLRDAVAAFVLKMGNVRTLDQATVSTREELARLISEGRCRAAGIGADS